MAKPISKDEEKSIIEAIKSGMKRNEIAKEFNRSAGSISRIARKNNMNFDRSFTKKATEAKQFYSKEKRMELLKKGFDKADELIDRIRTPRDLKDWGMSVAILVDKQRLEEGQPTEITKGEMKNTNNNYHEIDLDKLPVEVVREIAKADNERITKEKPDQT